MDSDDIYSWSTSFSFLFENWDDIPPVRSPLTGVSTLDLSSACLSSFLATWDDIPTDPNIWVTSVLSISVMR